MILIILLIISCTKLNTKIGVKEKISQKTLVELYDKKDFYYFQQYIDYLEYIKKNYSILERDSKKEDIKNFLAYTDLSSINVATIQNKYEQVESSLKWIKDEGEESEFVRDHYGNSPLHYAAYFGYYDIFELLLNQIPEDLLNSKVRIKPKPIHLLMINKDRIEDRKKILNLILNHNPKALEELDPVRHNPLMYAAMFNNLEMFKIIYDKNPLLLNEETTRNISALDYIGIYGNLDIYKYLIEEKNIDINEIDSEKRTVFMLACANNKKKIIDYCLHKDANISRMDNQKKSGMVYAAIYGNLDTIQKIINYSKDKNIKDSKEFQYNILISLFVFIELAGNENSEENLSNIQKISSLLIDNLNDININDEGITPLYYALDKEQYELMKIILERKDIKLFEKVGIYNNIFEAAIIKNDIEAFQLLTSKLNEKELAENINEWQNFLKENSKKGFEFQKVKLFLDEMHSKLFLKENLPPQFENFPLKEMITY